MEIGCIRRGPFLDITAKMLGVSDSHEVARYFLFGEVHDAKGGNIWDTAEKTRETAFQALTDENDGTKGDSIDDYFEAGCGVQSGCLDLPCQLYVDSEDRGRLTLQKGKKKNA